MVDVKTWIKETGVWSIVAGVVLCVGFFAMNGCSELTEREYRQEQKALDTLQRNAEKAAAKLEQSYGDRIEKQLERLNELAARHAEQIKNEQAALGIAEIAGSMLGVAGVGGIFTAARNIHKTRASAAKDRMSARREGSEIGRAIGWRDIASAIAQAKEFSPQLQRFFDSEDGEKLKAIMLSIDPRIPDEIKDVKDPA